MGSQSRSFSKYLSKADVCALSLSCIIGWGAFVMPGTTFLPVAGPLGTAIAMIIGMAVMGVISANYAALMTEYPGIGSVYTYTKHALGGGHAFLSAWFLCLSYLALIPQNATTEQKDMYLHKIDYAGGQLLSIINDILDMSRIESGKMEILPNPTDLVQAVHEMEYLFESQMAEKQIQFTVDNEDVRDRWAMCDIKRLNRVILNLLSNAYKFTPEGGSVTVRLSETGKTDGMGAYQLSVRDTGIGMSPEFLSSLFRPFEREQTSTNSGLQGTGTGLGLSITKGIIDSMGGTIDVKTAPGEGTEFLVRASFPIVDPPREETESDTAEKLKERQYRLLLAEDNAINMEIAAMILTQEGFLIEKAVNGQIAVEMVSAAEPGYYDAVLMDIQMPVMDGYTAAKTIRALPDPVRRSVPIIAMTANAFAEDVQNTEKAQMQAHIAKPLDVPQMLRTIRKILTEQNAK